MPKLPVKGLNKSSIDRINKELLQKCNLIEPRYVPIVEQASYEGKEIIVLWIPGGADRPYKCPVTFPTEKAAESEKVYYIRKMSNSIRANQLEEKELFMLANNQPYDDRPNPAARPDDFFPYARIEVVDKPDPTGIGMTEKIFAGPLDRQLRDALSYIKNYIIKEKLSTTSHIK